MRCLFLSLLLVLAPLSGCFGEDAGDDVAPTLSVADVSMATRGQYMTIEVDSNVDWTFNRSAGLFYVDEFGVLRDPLTATFPVEKKSLELLILDSERESVNISVTAGDEFWNATLMLEELLQHFLIMIQALHKICLDDQILPILLY